MVEDRDNRLDASILFIETEIDLRIESIKAALDELFAEFKAEVKAYKHEFLK